VSQERRGEVHEEEGVIECAREGGKQREKGRQTPLEAPGRPGAEDLAHDDAEICRGGVKLQPLEDVLSASYEDPSQAAGHAQMREASFGVLGPQFLKLPSRGASEAHALGPGVLSCSSRPTNREWSGLLSFRCSTRPSMLVAGALLLLEPLRLELQRPRVLRHGSDGLS
jgi:hypothetical protein